MTKLLIAVVLMAMSAPAMATQYVTDYESVPPSQDFTVLGPSGAVGDLLERLVVAVSTSTTARVDISDGASTVPTQMVMPAVTPLGVHIIEIKARSNRGGWRVRTGNGVSVFAVGAFK